MTAALEVRGLSRAFGGLRATFVCDYAHTLILFVIIYLFFGSV